MTTSLSTKALIEGLVHSAGVPDAVSAIRLKAAKTIAEYRAVFCETSMPLNVEALASLLGISISSDPPVHSKDAELAPAVGGGVAIRVNPDRPETRRRFSVGHEITHTFFPDYQTKTWCRTDARYRRRDDPDDFVEMLCDIGSAELLMPNPWFAADAARVTTGAGLVDLALTYLVSREAMLRRFAETYGGTVASVLFSWKLKPTQHRAIGQLDQPRLFGDPHEEARLARKLRVDYSIPSDSFSANGHFIPNDKSVPNDGPLYEAASTGRPCAGECYLDLGTAAGQYRVMAIPVWTSDAELGPNGENGVGAVLEPLEVKRASRKWDDRGPTLFE